MALYDEPGITYDGTPTDASFVTALDRVEQLWRHLELDTLAPGGFTKEAIAAEVVVPTAAENANAVWAKELP